MYKIAVIGTHGAGKSTLCYKLAGGYKAQGKHVDLIQERIRFSPFPFNQEMSSDTAIWAYHRQVCRELEAKAQKADVAVCDRSAYDTFIYSEYFGFCDEQIILFKAAAERWLSTYNRIILVVPDMDIAGDGTRDTGKAFQADIHNLFLQRIKAFENTLSIDKITTSDIMNTN